jgi:glycolate oxidase
MKRASEKRLQEAFAERVLFGVEERLCYSFDATNVEYLPDCVVIVKDAEEVSRAVTFALEEGIPVIPRCAGSGFSGGAVAVRGGMVLSFEKMDHVGEIDRDRLSVRVEPGVVTARLQEEVQRLGLFYPPDPASLSFSMIGGNIGTNAGGPRGLKYGTTRDYVLDLEVVTPAFGRISTRKGNHSLDLTPLFVGSEGTLGVITEARLRLVKAPERTSSVLACFREIEKATQALDAMIGEGITPSTAEFIDRPTMECAFGEEPDQADIAASNVLLLEVDGYREEVEDVTGRVLGVLARLGSDPLRLARSESERARIWAVRRAISPSFAKIAPNKLNPDVCVPRSKLPDYLRAVALLGKKYSLRIFNFGHAGDGNIHTNIMFDGSDIEERKRAESLLAELFEKTIELEGTISGEHGIGVARKGVLPIQIGRKEAQLRKKYKSVFDPSRIMNPGKAV